ncbi:hypothetical protein Q4Q34_06120 [Flavivirga abyssicola]|uniref:DUF4760 domain-containing protein n=1 Tax=Flavivirga abyssicola TaxID=3063533 RepID=UPI0026E0387C|nr:hypothetical protein [Flavivirga sp. MEBiC07777]WVK14604.1 hypothetical protein Q4Q34_06120 [Flavivirga sp. MEBiC07777]
MEKHLSLESIVNITEICIGIFVLIGLYFAIKQFRIAKRTYLAQLLIPILDEYKDKKWIESREYLKNKVKDINTKEFEKRGVANLIHFFDKVGFLLSNKYVETDSIYQIMGGDIQAYWPKFKKYIDHRRGNPGPHYKNYPYGYHTQFLYTVCLKRKSKKEEEVNKSISILDKKIKALESNLISINN